MAVKVTVYGKADMTQIARARDELDRLERKAFATSSSFAGAMTSIADSTKRVGTAMSSTGDAMTRNLTVPIVALSAGLAKATQNAAEDSKAQVILAGALRNNAGATDAVVASTEAWITKQGKLLGVADDQLRPALSTLVGATKDVGKAQTLAGLSMDIAAARGVSVETAAKAVGKAYAGQTSQLTKLVPGIDAAAVKSKDFGEIYKSVNSIVGGQAKNASETAAGALQRNKVALDEATESLGNAFMPIMEDFTRLITTSVVPAVQKLASFFEGLSKDQKNAIVGFGLLLAVMGPVLSITGRLITGISGLANGMLFVGRQAVTAYGGLQNFVTGLTNANAGASAFATPMMKLGGLLRSATTATLSFVSATTASIAAGAKQAATFVASTVALVAQKVAMVAVRVATLAWTAAQWLLNVALGANPIGLVIIAIAALIAIVVVISRNIKQLSSFFSNAWNSIRDAVSSGINVVVSQLKGFVGQMLTLGRDIAQGLVNGIKSLGGAIWEAITSPITGAVEWVKDKLGIASPSQVTTEIGENFGQGFVNGVASKESAAVQAAANVATAAATTLNNGLSNLFNVDRTTAVNDLSGKGLLAAYSKMGGDVKDLTDAVLGDADAFARVQTRVQQVMSENPDAMNAQGRIELNPIRANASKFLRTLGTMRTKFKAEGSENNRIAKALGTSTGLVVETVANTLTTTTKKVDKTTNKVGTSTTKLAKQLKEGARLAKEAMRAWSMDDVVKPMTTSFETVLSAIQSQLTATANFVNNLAKLKGRLNTKAFSAILAMGPAQGGGIAQALVGATDAEIWRYNTAYAEQSRLTGILGNAQSGATQIAPVTISSGAIQVSIAGNADEGTVTEALREAIGQLVRELRSR